MTLQLASGFEAFNPLQGGGLTQFAAPDDGRTITSADVDGLLNNPAVWLHQTMRDKPFEMIEHTLILKTTGALMLEFLTSLAEGGKAEGMAVLAFRVKATGVRPEKAMYRVALVRLHPLAKASLS